MKIISLPTTALSLATISLISFTSCNEDADIGSTLVGSDGAITVEDNFSLTGHSTPIGSVQSKTIMQLIGDIDAKGYGTFHSDFITQFMPAAALDSILQDDSQIDGLRLIMMYQAGQFVGDSIVPMGLEVYRLNKTLEAPIYSNANPNEYYSPSNLLASKSYTATNSQLSDSLAALSYREIYVDLPKSLGVELFDMYKSNPASYSDPYVFCDKFKGLYVKNSFGSGRVTKIGATVMQLLYHLDTKTDAGRDTTYRYEGNFYAVSPEIVTNNNITYSMSTILSDRIAAGEAIIVAPAGQEVELQFPINDVISYYTNNKKGLTVLNDLTFSLPAERISNTYGIEPPEYLLMIIKDDKKKFFENSQIPDNIRSFYAKYNSTKGEYDFGSMRQYLINMLNQKTIDSSDFTFTITPISISTETSGSSYYGTQSTQVTAVAPYIEQPAMTKLNLEKAKIVLTFSNQNTKK